MHEQKRRTISSRVSLELHLAIVPRRGDRKQQQNLAGGNASTAFSTNQYLVMLIIH